MNISSAQTSYSITSSDIITIDLSSIETLTLPEPATIDFSSITGTSTTCGGGINGYTYPNASGTVSIGPLTSADISFTWQDSEWINRFPDWNRIERMCKEYPGLKIAFEKFKTAYNLVKDDYDAPPEKRIKP